LSYAVAQEIRERQRVAFERETFNRWRKVCTIVAYVPVGETVGLNGAAATLMESWSQADRNVFAKAAGAKSAPSEETWRLVCEVVRARPVPTMADADAHTRALPLLRVLGGLAVGGGS
jgi:hypothetical protein